MRRLATALTLASIVFASSTASADLIDPSEDACAGKKQGQACDADGVGGEGHCAASTCSRNDYSEGTPPKSVDYDCVVCKPGAAPEAKSDSKPVASSEGDKPKNKSGCAVGPNPVSLASLAAGLLVIGFVTRRRG